MNVKEWKKATGMDSGILEGWNIVISTFGMNATNTIYDTQFSFLFFPFNRENWVKLYTILKIVYGL